MQDILPIEEICYTQILQASNLFVPTSEPIFHLICLFCHKYDKMVFEKELNIMSGMLNAT